MKSPFNPDIQNTNDESKIVAALERIAEAFRVLLWNESKENALSPIQNQILIFLLFHSEEQCTISYLAKEFNMTKATISDSVRAMLNKDLVEKSYNPLDTRSYTISLTKGGKKIASQSAKFAFAIERPLGSLTKEQKENMLFGLLSLIRELSRSGIISIQRMCFTCVHYQFENNKHYCKLLQSTLENKELRVDCPEHEPA